MGLLGFILIISSAFVGAASKPPSRVHDPVGYEEHYRKRKRAGVVSTLLFIVGVILLIYS